MTGRRVLIAGALVAFIIVAYLLWWPSLLQAAQGMHSSVRLHP